MDSFKLWLTEGYEVPNGEILQHIKVAVPKVRQTKKFSCGAAVLKSIFEYFKVGPTSEEEIIKIANTTTSGTKPDDIVAAAKQFGLKTKMKEHMTIDEVKKYLDQEKPVICNFQAWGDPSYYKTRDSGHYAIAIGFNDVNIYFEDPSIDKNRGYLSIKEFDKRWHDKITNGIHTDHLGIVIWKDTNNKETDHVVKATKIK